MKNLPKLATMTDEQALKLKGKMEKKEDLTKEETQMVTDELIAQIALWAQGRYPLISDKTDKEVKMLLEINALKEELRKIQHPTKKWWQFWK